MAKIATVRLSWTKSPSPDVTSRKITITQNGSETVIDVGPEVMEYTLEVQASTSVQFKTEVFDDEGNKATSEVYSFTLGDLEAPLPDTLLTHDVLSVRDDTDPGPVVGKAAKK